MAVDAVTSSTNPYNAVLRQPAENQQTQQAQAPEKQEPKVNEPAAKQEEAPKPVVNAQGQTTGTLINITA